ncbi:MAG: hypothetical protein EPO63_03980 [Candidatus Nitrosotenuis sp.]|nr:MAG: hypothetical protein EPO63_03980 [Candidatus Nitrosotenuis sp.]
MMYVLGAILALVMFSGAVPLAFSDSYLTTIEEKQIKMTIPSGNTLPWAFVEGTTQNMVDGHPVIIQIYKDEKPVRFAQVDVNDDGTYQYKFRVRDVTDDKVTNIFEGDYTVKIFKTINLDSDYLNEIMKQKSLGNEDLKTAVVVSAV